MAFNTAAVLTYLADTVAALAGVQRVYQGVPESMSNQVSAYVAVAGQDISDKATSLLQREARYLVAFGYRVKGAEATAEQQIAALVDALAEVWRADRTLGATCATSSLDLSLADTPAYQTFAGQEYRIYPVVVTAVQRQSFPGG